MKLSTVGLGLNYNSDDKKHYFNENVEDIQEVDESNFQSSKDDTDEEEDKSKIT